jgi:uncharacterized UPF0160 family protein
VYENFIEEIDGMDNGVSAYEGLPKYKVTTTLSHRVGYLCPSWQSKHQVIFLKLVATGSDKVVE